MPALPVLSSTVTEPKCTSTCLISLQPRKPRKSLYTFLPQTSSDVTKQRGGGVQRGGGGEATKKSHPDDDFLFKSSHTHALSPDSLRKFLNKCISYCSKPQKCQAWSNFWNIKLCGRNLFVACMKKIMHATSLPMQHSEENQKD